MNIEGGLNFKWDKNKCGSGILLTSGDTCVFLKESSYIFRTVLGDQVIIKLNIFRDLKMVFIIGKLKQIAEQKMN